MMPRWETRPTAPVLEGKLYMDAELRPHRSLSLAACRLMLIAVIAVNAGAAAVFWANGAFPVVGFLGLDVLALGLAFRLNYRAARVVERVRIAKDCVHVAAVAPSGRETHWALNPIWARVAREGRGVFLQAGPDAMLLGAFLSPKECESFAAALDAALYRAKRGA
jgi:uncharacterized membrane protein